MRIYTLETKEDKEGPVLAIENAFENLTKLLFK
jgi:hypothetical protein